MKKTCRNCGAEMVLLDRTVAGRGVARKLSRFIVQDFLLELILIIIVIPGAYIFHLIAGKAGAVGFVIATIIMYFFLRDDEEDDLPEVLTYGCNTCRIYDSVDVAAGNER